MKKRGLVGVEAGGRGSRLGEHAASICHGDVGVLHGAMSYLLQDENGQVATTHSVSAGLDYPGVGPEHAYLHTTGRVEYRLADDGAALEAFQRLSRLEGIIPAMESSHAIAAACDLSAEGDLDDLILVNLSGREDKDLDIYAAHDGGSHGSDS